MAFWDLVGAFIAQYFLAIVVFLLVDMVWLLKVAPKFYRANIGHLMADKPNLLAALIFYLTFILGLVYFVTLPHIDDAEAWLTVWIDGLLYGLMTYATFDLTSMAVFKKFPTKVVVIDLLWGMFISSTVSLIVYLILSRLYS
jgi:uncharacterized membrane protein